MKLKQQKMLHEEHYKKEISDCEAGIDELRRRDKELDLQIRRQQMDIGQRRNECELKRKELEMAAQRSMDAVRREKADVEGQLQALDALIEAGGFFLRLAGTAQSRLARNDRQGGGRRVGVVQS